MPLKLQPNSAIQIYYYYYVFYPGQGPRNLKIMQENWSGLTISPADPQHNIIIIIIIIIRFYYRAVNNSTNKDGYYHQTCDTGARQTLWTVR